MKAKKKKHRNYRKDRGRDDEGFSDISIEEGGSKTKHVSKYASVASSFIEAVESATLKGLKILLYLGAGCFYIVDC